eukprot:4523456-Karenia_brevis.AAC.1
MVSPACAEVSRVVEDTLGPSGYRNRDIFEGEVLKHSMGVDVKLEPVATHARVNPGIETG